MAVFDNEHTNLALIVAHDFVEGEGSRAGGARVSISGTLPDALTIALASDDLTLVAVPPHVVIPAGSTQALIELTIGENAVAQGTRTVLLSATAAGFVATVSPVRVQDNDPHHFAIDAIPAPLYRSDPFTVSITALDVSNRVVTAYSATARLDAGLPTLPDRTGPFDAGAWTGSIAIDALGNELRLVVSDDFGHSGTSAPFNVLSPPPHATVLHYGFDAMQGAVVSDLSGNGHTGTVLAAAWHPSGVKRGAMAFNGLDSAVAGPVTEALIRSGRFTISLWYRTGDAVRQLPQYLCGVHNTAHGGNAMRLRTQGSDDPHPGGLAFQIRSAGVEAALYFVEPIPVAGLSDWYHVAVTVHAALGQFRLYLNGEELADGTFEAPTVDFSSYVNPYPLLVGNLGEDGQAPADRALDGRVDEFQIFSWALTPEEVHALYGDPEIDTDGDGLSDAWERDKFGTLDRDGCDDYDGDGATDAAEAVAGTCPTNALDVLRIHGWETPADRATSGLLFRWDTISGRAYTVWCATNLMAEWTPVTNPPSVDLTGQGLPLAFSNETLLAPGLYYRIGVRVPPE